jgi:hypothetical protein
MAAPAKEIMDTLGTILPTVLYGYKSPVLTLKEEQIEGV